MKKSGARFKGETVEQATGEEDAMGAMGQPLTTPHVSHVPKGFI